jgi:hypothetical protein
MVLIIALISLCHAFKIEHRYARIIYIQSVIIQRLTLQSSPKTKNAKPILTQVKLQVKPILTLTLPNLVDLLLD